MTMNARKLLANLGSATASRVGSAALSFALFWWLTRKLPPDQLGGFALTMSCYFVLQGLPLLGLQLPLARAAATHPEDLDASVNSHWWFALPVSVALAAALIVYGHFYNGGLLQWPFVILAVAMLPTSWTAVAEAALVGTERISRIAVSNLLEAAWRLMGAGCAVALGGGLSWVLAVFLVGRCATALYYWRLPELPSPHVRSPPSISALAQLWTVMPVYLSLAAVAAVSSRFDILALAQLVSLDEVAAYSTGAKLYEAMLMVPTLLAFVMLPTLARLFTQDRDGFILVLPFVLSSSLLVGLPLALLGVFSAPWGLHLLFPGFSAAVPVVQLLLFAAALATLDVVLSSTMVAANAQVDDLRCITIAFAVLAIATVALVPSLGIVGAAAAVVLNMIARVIYRVHWATTTMNLRGLWKVLGGGGVAVGIALIVFEYLSSLAWPLPSILALCSYFGVCFLFGLINLRSVVAFPATISTLIRRFQ